MRKQKSSILVVFAVAFLWGVCPVEAATPIVCGMIIIAPGQYILTSDLTCGLLGVAVNANNVHINLKGHTLTGPGDGDGLSFGIVTADPTVPVFVAVTGLHVNGGTVTGFNFGICLCAPPGGSTTMNAHVNNMTLKGNSFFGIWLLRSNRNQVNGNDLSDNGLFGVLSQNSHDNRFHSNEVNSNGSANNFSGGFNLVDSSNNRLTSNNLLDNEQVGVRLLRSHHNRFHSNDVNRNVTADTFAGGFALRASSNNLFTSNNILDNGSAGGSPPARASAGVFIGLIANVFSNRNTVRGNIVNGNSRRGIVVGGANNKIQSNTASLNTNAGAGVGIWISTTAIDTTIQSNTALGNSFLDVLDFSPNPCVDNIWKNNTFVTSSDVCIQ